MKGIKTTIVSFTDKWASWLLPLSIVVEKIFGIATLTGYDLMGYSLLFWIALIMTLKWLMYDVVKMK